MHRITMWIALAISAIGMVICYQVNASGLTANPAVPTDQTGDGPGIRPDGTVENK